MKNKVIYRNNLDQGKIDYSVIHTLIAAGYVDAYRATNTDFKNSIPSKSHAKEHAKLSRIDYFLAKSNISLKVGIF